MPSSARSTRRAVQRLANEWSGGTDPSGRASRAARAFLGLLVAALAEERGRLPRSTTPVQSLQRLEAATGYHFLPVHAPGAAVLEAAWVRARDVAHHARCPHAALSETYQDMVRHYAISANGVVLRTSDEHRKRHGIFYTPPEIVRWVTQQALAPLSHGVDPRILDPAMGTGTFLLETVRALDSRNPAETAERSLFGIDRDPIAVRLAVLALWIETGARPEVLRTHLCCGDALRASLPPVSFDAVVGNPPWGAAYAPEERDSLRRRFPDSCRRSFDSFKLFLDLGSRISRGTLGMVLPHAFLGQMSYVDVREMLLGRMAPYAARDLGDGLFTGAAAPACAVIFGPRPGPATIATGVKCALPARRWGARGFPLAPDGMLTVLRRLSAAHQSLGEISAFRVRDVGVNYNRASVAARIFYAGRRADSRDVPRYRGRGFAAYTTPTAEGWLRHDAREHLAPGETVSAGWSTFCLPEKIVVRQTADRPIATIDRSCMAMGRSVIAITAEGDVSLRALLACLNSELLATLYRTLSGEEGRILPQVKVGTLHRLPVPAVAGLAIPRELLLSIEERLTEDEEGLIEATAGDPSLAWAVLDRLAARLLDVEGEDPHVDELIDRVVEGLYGVSTEERRVLTPADDV